MIGSRVSRVCCVVVGIAGLASPTQAIVTSQLGLDVNALVGAERFYSAGYTGTRATAANIEAGHAWDQHESLGHISRFFQTSNPGTAAPDLGEFDIHATWVAQAIAGRGPTRFQQGIAYGAELWSGAIAVRYADFVDGEPVIANGPFFTTTRSVVDPYAEAMLGISGNGRADVVNGSWGFTEPTGANIQAAIIDAMADQSGTIAVFSAGNSGPGGNTVGGIGAGFNTITAGALASEFDAVPFDTPAGFSSRGPNDYFDPTSGVVIPGVRAAVDLAAPGQDLVLAFYGGPTGGNRTGADLFPDDPGATDLYSFGVGGTSFSAPIIAGGAALVVDAGKHLFGTQASIDARVVKSVLQNSARKTDGWDNGQSNVGGVITTSQSLDWATGAGALDLDRAFAQYTAGTTDVPGLGGETTEAVGWDYAEIDQGGVLEYTFDEELLGGTTFTATLNWFVGYQYDYSADATLALFGSFIDLDLSLFRLDEGQETLIAQSVSAFNNTEHLSFTLPSTGEYLLRVDWFGENYNFDGTVSEPIGLAWAGTVVPAPSGIALIGASAIIAARRRRWTQ